MTELTSGPVFALDGARLDALELLLAGLTGPIDGYALPGKRPESWSSDSILHLSADIATIAHDVGVLTLTDADGTPLAALSVTAIEAAPEGFFVAGKLVALQPAEHPPARDIRFSPLDRSPGGVVAVFAAPPRPQDISRAIVAAAGGPLLLLAMSWNAAHADYRVSKTIDELRRCSAEVPGSTVRFLALAELHPGMEAGEALALALDSNKSPRTLLDFSAVDLTSPDQSPKKGIVVIFSGLSGSGKSTVARALTERIAIVGIGRAVLLDGDDVRRILSPGLGFSASERAENLRRIGWVAAQIASVGGIAIGAPIAPFARAREGMRQMVEPASRFVLVHVATPIEICEARDRKGLYALARAGKIVDFTGIDSPYEVPFDADVAIDTSIQSTHECVESILEAMSSITSAETTLR